MTVKLDKINEEYRRRIISPESIDVLVDQGFNKVDTHRHSDKSKDVIPDDEMSRESQYAMLQALGFFPIIFTDHDNSTPFKDTPAGIEITFRPLGFNGYENPHTLHINAYNFNPQQRIDMLAIANKIKDERRPHRARGDLLEFIDYVSSNKIPHSLNHPCYFKIGELPDWHHLMDIVSLFDVVEGYNYGRTRANNEAAIYAAQLAGKVIIGGEDSHVGGFSVMNMVKGDTFEEVWDNILNNQHYVVNNSLDIPRLNWDIQQRFKQIKRVDSDKLKNQLKSYKFDVGWLDTLIEKFALYANGDKGKVHGSIYNVAENLMYRTVMHFAMARYFNPMEQGSPPMIIKSLDKYVPEQTIEL